MKITNIYLIHGYTASPTSNWFQDFKANLDSDTVKVDILEMPNSNNPQLAQWIAYMKDCINRIDENTIFVGHSLGCVSILHYLNQVSVKKIKALFMVSGFIERTPIPELKEFIQPQLNYSKFKEIAENIVSISAKDDDIVPYNYSEYMAKKLDSEFILLNQGKHFIDRDNITVFPLLINEIKKIL